MFIPLLRGFVVRFAIRYPSQYISVLLPIQSLTCYPHSVHRQQPPAGIWACPLGPRRCGTPYPKTCQYVKVFVYPTIWPSVTMLLHQGTHTSLLASHQFPKRNLIQILFPRRCRTLGFLYPLFESPHWICLPCQSYLSSIFSMFSIHSLLMVKLETR